MATYTFYKWERFALVEPPDTSISVIDFYKDVKNYEDEPGNLTEARWAEASGLEDLGGGVKVGVTVQMQGARVGFVPDTVSVSSGTVTTEDSNGEVLVDSGATYETDGVLPGALVLNLTDGSVGTVLSVDSQNQIRNLPLDDGSDDQWEVGDSYKIWNIKQCSIAGGNLTFAGGNPADAVIPTAFTQVVLASSSSATLQEQEDIRFASFNNGVTLDSVNGNDLNRGNAEFPVKTLLRAQEVAEEYGFNTLYIKGSLTLLATDDVRDYNLNGEAPNKSYVYVTDGCLTNQVHFNHLSVEGDLTGSDADFCDCFVANVTGLVGILQSCYLAGALTLGGTSSDIVTFTNCYLGTTAVGLVEINMNGDGPALAMRPYTGGVRILNKSGESKVAIDFISGRMELESSVTAGTFYVRGAGAEITKNEATGISLFSAPLTNPATVSDSVWDEKLSEHLVIGSTGEALEAAKTSELSPAEIADAVWDEVRSEHKVLGSFGETLQIGDSGTAQAGTSRTLTLATTASAVNNYYIDDILLIIGGQGAGQSRRIKSYVGGTRVASIQTAWGTVPNNTSQYVVLPGGKTAAVDAPQVVTTTTIASLASQTEFTLAEGSPDDNAYNSFRCVIIDSADPFQVCLGFVLDYVGSSKTVYLKSDPAVFTFNVGDQVMVLLDSVDQEAIVDAVWEEPFEDHKGVAGSMAQQILVLSGLSHENVRMYNQVFTDVGNNRYVLDSCSVRVYPTAADADADTNAVREYSMTATYDGNNNLNLFKMVKV